MQVRQDRKFVREQFFPLLCEATESIADADMFLQTFSTMLMETFLGKMREIQFVDLKVADKLDPQSPQFATITKLVTLFDGKTVGEAQKLIEGMKEEVKWFFKEEMKTRKLESLKVNWLDDGAIETPYAGL